MNYKKISPIENIVFTMLECEDIVKMEHADLDVQNTQDKLEKIIKEVKEVDKWLGDRVEDICSEMATALSVVRMNFAMKYWEKIRYELISDV